MTFDTVDPSTGCRLASYEEMTREQVDAALDGCVRAWRQWRRVPVSERAFALRRLAAVLRDGKEAHARLMAGEMGKVLAEGRSEVEKCAWACEHFAEHGPALLRPEVVATDAERSYTVAAPLGVVLAVMPWNFPFWQVFRFGAATLLGGNAILLKHARNVTGCALAIERAVEAAGFPDGLLRVVIAGHEEVERLCARPEVAAVTLTGSTEAGRKLGAVAGAALKKTVLELGGSDPYVVLADADLEHAARTCVAQRLVNAGQSCIAAKRFVVVQPVARRFTGIVVEQMRARPWGDPTASDVAIGPLARHDLRDQVHDQVVRSVAAGAALLLGGQVPDHAGAFYPPTVLAGVRPGMAAFDEEVFGPVAAIVEAADEADAVRLANASPFGLGAAVFTRDLARGERIAAEELDGGACFVNAAVRSDPRLPFGGVKESGHGRELGAHGLAELLNVKTVWIAPAG